MKISIIIPAYNIEKYIQKCIISCINQTYQNIEIIVINDGSTDMTAKMITDLEKEDTRIIFINKKNEGVTLAREKGVEKSSGAYLFFLDGDDFLPNVAIEKLINKASTSNSEIILGNYSFFEETGKEKEKVLSSFDTLTNVEFIKYMLENNQLYLCFKLIKKSLYQGISIPKEITLGEDAIGIIQIVSNSKKVSKVDDIIYHYFRRNNSVTKNPQKRDFINAYKSIELVLLFLKNNYPNKFNYEIEKTQLLQLIMYLSNVDITGYYRKDITKVLKTINFHCLNYKTYNLNIEQCLALKLSILNVRFAVKFLRNFIKLKIFIVKLRNIIKKGKV